MNTQAFTDLENLSDVIERNRPDVPSIAILGDWCLVRLEWNELQLETYASLRGLRMLLQVPVISVSVKLEILREILPWQQLCRDRRSPVVQPAP